MYSRRRSKRKELLASLGWREVAQALDDPALVVALTEFRQRAPQFLRVLDYPDPQQLLFQRANQVMYLRLSPACGVDFDLRITLLRLYYMDGLDTVSQNAQRTEFKIVDEPTKLGERAPQGEVVPNARGKAASNSGLIRIQFPRVKIHAH